MYLFFSNIKQMDVYLDELVDVFRKNPTVRLGVALTYGMAVIGQRQRFDVDGVQVATELYRDRKITQSQLFNWMQSQGYTQVDFEVVLSKMKSGLAVTSSSIKLEDFQPPSKIPPTPKVTPKLKVAPKGAPKPASKTPAIALDH
tara:strand:- start:1042 stop:1473 length:432 start_codon:yes stop_codon:yes gene_type:complete